MTFKSTEFWRGWYKNGNTSGAGSYGNYASYKAEFLNDFVAKNGIQTVLELGCGDGNQASLFHFPGYVGYDISEDALERCRALGLNVVSEIPNELFDLVLSLDVCYHLVEDEVWADHILQLFAHAKRFVIIYTTQDGTRNRTDHILHRDPPSGWTMQAPNPVDPLGCNFYVYQC